MLKVLMVGHRYLGQHGTLPLAQVILVDGVDIEIPTHNGWTLLLMSL
jgi:hypothetical protein